MRFYLLLLFIAGMLPLPAVAQQFRGRVYDDGTSAPIGTVIVTNTHSGAMWVSDSAGGVAFTAYPGDIITFQHPAYRLYNQTIVTYNDVVSIGLAKAPIQLAEVQVLSPMLRFRRDSAFNHQFFHKELGYARSQVKMESTGGIGASGLISELALAITGKKKYYKRFEHEMTMLEEMRYASIRYTPSLVTAQTGLDDSAANAFIIKHPIPNDFVREASELELKMWVREQWRGSLKADSAVKSSMTGRR